MNEATFLFVSPLALKAEFLRVAELITQQHGLQGHVLAPEEYEVTRVHHLSGRLSRDDFDPSSTPLTVHFLRPRKGNVGRFGLEGHALRALLRGLKPDYVWIHAEFWEGIARQFLWHYRLRRRPRMVAYAATNSTRGPTRLLSARWPFLSRTRLTNMLLWPRLDGVAACAAGSLRCARRMGLPSRVPVLLSYLPVLGPDDAAREGIIPPWQTDGTFTVGFAGLLNEQKGWKVLLSALERLPDRFKVVIVGDGHQREELQERLARPGLSRRAYYAGSLPWDQLLATYARFDVFVLPSVTCPPSPEQFGCVLAEAMACGVPVIGSDSGAIPETVGEAGLVVPEGDAEALARAILRISQDPDLRGRSIARGYEKYRRSYSCAAYARAIAALLEIPKAARIARRGAAPADALSMGATHSAD